MKDDLAPATVPTKRRLRRVLEETVSRNKSDTSFAKNEVCRETNLSMR
ncbi:MAG: hypothetical protein QXJ86_03440 [Nitrososphaerales archaeon]